MEGSGIDKKKYKMLKAACKEEREARITYEIELNKLNQKFAAQTKEFEDTKDKNLQLEQRNIELEEKLADLKTRVRVTDKPTSDSEHMKEMLGTQNLLREEMKEKEFKTLKPNELVLKLVIN